MTGYSMTMWWQLLSYVVVFGTLAGIGYCVWDAQREARELDEWEEQIAEECRELESRRSYRYIS
jgi:hypothetical protein